MPIKKIVINGGNKLAGKIEVSGSKNAVLKQICTALLLTNGTLTLHNVPNLFDTEVLLELMNLLGTKITLDTTKKTSGKTIILDCSKVNSWFAPYELVSKMRASFNTLGALLSRFGKAKVSLPGGCAIGQRGFDIHFESLKQMGVDIQVEDGYVVANATKGKVQGANINFRFASVGATENVMFAAVLADGVTIINNAAKEPEIVDIANCINAMGGKVNGAGTSTITIEGVKELHSAEYTTMGDRMEAGTYMIGAVMTDGNLILSGLDFNETLGIFIEKLKEIGAEITTIDKNTISIKRARQKLSPINITTEIYPGFPTDLQAPFISLMAILEGESVMDETIYENRFLHVPELCRMNANIRVDGNKAVINGKSGCYKSAKVMASDLRGSVALMLAGLVAKGQTEMKKFYFAERGYENIASKLNNCGADVKVLYE